MSLRRCACLTLFATLVGFALFYATEAVATSSRIRSLGGGGGYFEDDNNVLRWYGSLPEYGNLAVVELGTFDLDADDDDAWDERVSGQGGGFHVNFDQAGKWGTAAIYTQEDSPGWPNGGTPGGHFSALYGRRFGAFTPGLYFRGTSFTQTDATDDSPLLGLSEYLHDFGLGLRVDAAENVYFDLAGEIMNSQFDYIATGDAINDDDYTNTWDSYGLRARLFWRLSEKVAWVPLFDYYKDDRETFSVLMRDVAKLDAHLLRAGFGFNVFPDSDNMVLFSAEYRSGKENLDGVWSPAARYHTSRNEFFSLSTRFAVESRVVSWLTLRAGVAYHRIDDEYYRIRYVSNDDDEYVAQRSVRVEVPLSLGLGMAFGHFGADLVINGNTPFSLGYLFTGAAGSEIATFSSITLSYWF